MLHVTELYSGVIDGRGDLHGFASPLVSMPELLLRALHGTCRLAGWICYLFDFMCVRVYEHVAWINVRMVVRSFDCVSSAMISAKSFRPSLKQFLY